MVAQLTLELGGVDRVTATIRDVYGRAVPGVVCTFAIVSQPDTDGALTPSFGATDGDGQVATTLHAGETPGTIRLQARCGDIIMGAEVRVVASPPASLPGTGIGAAGGRSRALLLGLAALAFLFGLFGISAAQDALRVAGAEVR